MLRKGCGPERRPDEDDEERHVWLSSQNIIRVMKTRKMMCVCGGGDLQRVCRRRAVSTEFWWGNLLEGNTRKTRRQMRDIIKIDLN